jgi:hypothetical protein
MKKHWLRGMLLGVSMALLLSGGVGLAASVKTQASTDCFECIPRAEFTEPLPEGKFVDLTNSGYDPGEDLSFLFTIEGSLWDEGVFYAPLNGPPCTPRIWVYCENLLAEGEQDCDLEGTGFPAEVDPSAVPYAEYGEWVWRIEQNGDADEVSFLFAEDCAAARFVPEPGSILLLGSGLAGLAGYATLRWRGRE